MLHFHNTFEYMQKSATYAAKASNFWGLCLSDPMNKGFVPGLRHYSVYQLRTQSCSVT